MELGVIFTTYVLPILAVLGAGGGIISLFKVRAEKRKMAAESGKTTAETDRIVAETRMERETKIIALYERTIDKVQEDNEILNAKLDRLTLYVEMLVVTMREANVPIPPMPPIPPLYLHNNGQSPN